MTHRKARPLIRDVGKLRDDRLFVIACDDTYAPKQYFSFFSIPRVQVHVVSTDGDGSSSNKVLERLLAIDVEPHDERWLVLDSDHYINGAHVDTLRRTLRRARQKGVKVAMSRPSFEVWLLLHHVDYGDIGELNDAKVAEKLLREVLGSYNKTKVRAGDFPLELVPIACRRGIELDVKPDAIIPPVICSRVYRIWKSIVEGASPTQLPIALQGFSFDPN